MADSSTRVLFTGTERVETTALVMVEWTESGGVNHPPLRPPVPNG